MEDGKQESPSPCLRSSALGGGSVKPITFLCFAVRNPTETCSSFPPRAPSFLPSSLVFAEARQEEADLDNFSSCSERQAEKCKTLLLR